MAYSIAKIRKEIRKNIKENPKDCFRKLLKECFNSWVERKAEHLENPKSLKTLDRDDLEDLWDYCAEMVRDNMNEAYAETMESIDIEKEPEKET